MTQEKPHRTVTAKVLGHKLHSNGSPMTELEVPEWSKFPIPLYGIKEEQQALLPMGQTVRVVLRADKLRREDADPAKPYNYLWSFRGLADAEADDPQARKPMATPPQQQEGLPFDDPPPRQQPTGPQHQPDSIAQAAMDRDRSIRRQVALKSAVDRHAGQEVLNDTILRTATEFAAFLEGQEAV